MEIMQFTHDLGILDKEGQRENSDKPSYMIILNRKLKKELFKFMYQRINTLICSDGGANHLFNCF